MTSRGKEMNQEKINFLEIWTDLVAKRPNIVVHLQGLRVRARLEAANSTQSHLLVSSLETPTGLFPYALLRFEDIDMVQILK